MDTTPVTAPPLSAPAAVLTDPPLLLRITQFQRGFPAHIHELIKVYDASGESPEIEREYEVSRAMASVMRYGSLADVQMVLHAYRSSSWSGGYMDQWALPDCAASLGRLDVLQWLHSIDDELAISPWERSVLLTATRGKHDDVVRWLTANRPDTYTYDANRPVAMAWCLAEAAGHGNLPLLQELIALRPDALTSDVMDKALRYAQWDVIHYLHEYSPAGCSSDGMDWAAEEGHLDVVKFLQEHRTEGCTTRAMTNAASRGHLDIIEFLHENRTEGCRDSAMDFAAGNGHLDVVHFLHENRTEGCTTRAMDIAAWSGHLDVVQFLHENRTEGCTSEAIDLAATKGYLDVIQFLHEHRTEGCTTDAMDIAAAYGYPQVVRFLHEHRSEGCSIKAMDEAAANGELEIVQFLHENRTEGCTNRALVDAAVNGHMDVVKFLHEKRGLKVAKWIMYRVLTPDKAGNLAVVRYLHESLKIPLPHDFVERAKRCGDKELVAYAVSQHTQRSDA